MNTLNFNNLVFCEKNVSLENINLHKDLFLFRFVMTNIFLLNGVMTNYIIVIKCVCRFIYTICPLEDRNEFDLNVGFA